eukprot:723442_1
MWINGQMVSHFPVISTYCGTSVIGKSNASSSIDNALQSFYEKFITVQSKEEVAQRWVHCTTVEKADELTRHVMDFVFGDLHISTVCKPETEDTKASETSFTHFDTDQAPNEEDQKENEPNEHGVQRPERNAGKCEDLIGKMMWRKSKKNTEWYPSLVISIDTNTGRVE